MILAIKGKLTATEASEFGAKVDDALKKSSVIQMDFQGVSYIAPAGLRLLLSTQKKTAAMKGKFTLANVNQTVMEVLEVTGLDEILQFE
jgi:anti-sigma B factor antagonist